MGYISVRNAHKEFMKDGEPLTILEDINLDIEKGEFICLLGPSGSGKSTLLNAMAGFELVTSGSITIDGEEVKSSSTQICNSIPKTMACCRGVRWKAILS